MTLQDVEIAIFRAFSEAGVILPAEMVTGIAATAVATALVDAEAESAQGHASELAKLKATASTEAARAVAGVEKDLGKRLAAEEAKVLRRDEKLKKVQEELREANAALSGARGQALQDVRAKTYGLTSDKELKGVFGTKWLVPVKPIEDFVGWLDDEIDKAAW